MSELGIFGDLDLSNASDDPFFKDDGTYRCNITQASMKESKNGNKGFTFDYTIDQEDESGKGGQKIQEWKNVPQVWQVKGYATKEDMENGGPVIDKIKADAARDLAFLKLRFKEFGFTDEEMNTLTPSDFLNMVGPLDITIFHKDGQERIAKVVLADTNDEAGDSVDPFA